MNSWTLVTVETIKAQTTAALSTGPFGSSISSRHFQKTGVPVIRGSNLSEDVGVRLIHDDLVFLSEEKAREFSRSRVGVGDLIFTCWGTVGQVGYISGHDPYGTYIISNKQMKLTPDPSKTDSLFLYYLFSSPDIRRRIQRQGIGSSVPGFNLGQLRTIEFLLPPFPEQRAIAHILGTLDDKIELNQRMNATLEAMARALFQSWFVDFDPVRARAERRQPEGMDAATAALFPDEFEETELGEVPRGWSVRALPEAIAVNPPRRLQSGAVSPYLEMANMPTSSARALDWAPREFTSGMRFTNGDVLVARITPCLENGKTAFVDFLADNQVGWGSTEYIVFRAKPPLPPTYAYFLARTEGFRMHAIQNMTGTSGRQRVPAEAFNSYLMVSPSPEVAERFGNLAESTMRTLKRHDEESKTLAALRDALLPKLLSGEMRVGEAEWVVEGTG